jgi:hypothetical protein
MLNAKHSPCSAKPCLNFVDDQKGPMFLKDLVNLEKIVVRRRDNPALSQERFCNKCRNAIVCIKVNDILQSPCTPEVTLRILQFKEASIAVRSR